MGRFLALLSAVLLSSAVAATAVAGKKLPLQHVTIFSDSSGAALNWDSTAKRVVEHGNRVLLELHPCGRLVQPGCLTPHPPPSVLATVRKLGLRIGPSVVVFVAGWLLVSAFQSLFAESFRAFQSFQSAV